MNVQKFYEAIAKITAAREGVRIEVKSIKKVPEAELLDALRYELLHWNE